jgi:Ca-activated chloride channel family protein
MPERSELGKNPTRAIVLLSDGIDNASKLTREQIARQLEGVAIPIYALGLREPAEATAKRTPSVSEELSDLELLGELSQRTGGKMFAGDRPEQMTRAVASMTNDLRAQYLIGFPPTGKGPVKYRNISLKLSGRVRSVRVRAGYRGTEPPVLSTTASSGKNRRNERKKNS